MISKIFLTLLFLIGLIYLLLPGPSSINDIAALPDSLKSDEPGDTYQSDNIAAYFAQQRRGEITTFYKKEFTYLSIFGFKIPPLVFNRPIEEAQTAVRDQIQSSFLEEYTYPLRDSLYVNGYDRIVWNELNNAREDLDNKTIIIKGERFNSKTTLRYYRASIFWRITIYIGLWVLLIVLSKITYRAWKKY